MDYKKKSLLIYVSICGVLLLCSLIGLFFGIWEITCAYSFGFVFALIYYFLLTKGMSFITPESEGKGIFLFYLMTFLRFLCIILSLVLPALIFYFTSDGASKFRYLYLILTTLPFLGVTALMMIDKSKGEKA